MSLMKSDHDDTFVDWAKNNRLEAEQFAQDATRILSSTEERCKDLEGQAFYQRVASTLSGKTGEMERANIRDLATMQKMTFQCVEKLQEHNLLNTAALVTVKNQLTTSMQMQAEMSDNLDMLADDVAEIADSVNELGRGLAMLAEQGDVRYRDTLVRFEELEANTLELVGAVAQQNYENYYELKTDIARLEENIIDLVSALAYKTADGFTKTYEYIDNLAQNTSDGFTKTYEYIDTLAQNTSATFRMVDKRIDGLAQATDNLVTLLAKKTSESFEKLESRIDQLETSTNLQGWVLGLEEREYNTKFKSEVMRFFKVINDFYSLKSDDWTYNDLMLVRKALRTVGIDPNKKISLKSFIENIVDEILKPSVGFQAYSQAITLFTPDEVADYTVFIRKNISSPIFLAIHEVQTQYLDRREVVETLQNELSSMSNALKKLLNNNIERLNVNLDYKFPIADAAVEILTCMRLTKHLASLPAQNDAAEILTASFWKQATAGILERKIEQGVNIHSTDENGDSLLHLAIRYSSYPELVTSLLRNGLSLNRKNNQGNSPLHYAALYSSCSEIVNILAQLGADINAKNIALETALDIAVKTAPAPIMDALFKNGAKIK